MAGFGYGGFGSPYGGMGGFGGPYGGMGGFGGGIIQQDFEQERIGYGPQGFGIYEQETIMNRNPFTGATTNIQENEFMPMRGGYGGGYGMGYGFGFF